MHVQPVILAIASPPGRSLRGMIRISGAASFDLLRPHLHIASVGHSHFLKIVRKSAFANPDDQVNWLPGAHRAIFSITASLSFSVWTFIAAAPRSYTGENCIELQMPGNPILLERAIDAILESAGALGIEARRAQPGEFTARAFFNGKLSLTQAEGVAATIAAQSDAELRAAHMLSSGSLGLFAHQLADDLANALALVEAGIDFTDQEDVVAISPGDLLQRLSKIQHRIENQLSRAVGMEQLQAIPWVVLVGEPNAGKSALFNALLGHERAVISPVAGTTRDVLAEPLMLQTSHGPAEVMLVDLAGLDESHSSINQLMQHAAKEATKRAELILRCVPIDQTPPPQSSANEILVRTKSDTLPQIQDHPLTLSPPHSLTLSVSAVTGHNLNALKSLIADRLAGRAVSLAADAVALRPRHEAALRSAMLNLAESLLLIEPVRHERSLPQPELIAAAMRSALDELAALAGDITPDDVLGRVFATFCVGK